MSIKTIVLQIFDMISFKSFIFVFFITLQRLPVSFYFILASQY